MPLIPDQLRGAGVLRLRKPIAGVEDYYVLVRPVTSLGRHPGNHIAVPKASISRHHARIEHSGEVYVVEDLGSSNGTFVNGQPIRCLELKSRDTVTFGDVDFTFFLDEETTPRHGTRADSTQVHLRPNGEAEQAEVLRTQSVVDAEKAFAEIGEIHSVSQALKYLRTHYRLLELIRQRPSEERLMESFLEILFDVVRADRGVIMLSQEERPESLRPEAVRLRGGDDVAQEVNISQTIASKCVLEQLAILSSDITKDERFSEAASVVTRPVRSAICVPLLIRGRVLGVCYLDTQKGIQAFDEADLNFVANLSAQLALALDNLRMTRERLQAEQLAIIGRTMTEVAHNIKNVLLVTKGGAEMMDRKLDEGDLDSIKETWELVRRGMDRMNRMAVDMLSYARLDDRKPRETHLNEIVEEVVEQFRAKMETQSVSLRFEPGAVAGVCWVDPVGLFDVLANLFVNAQEAIAPASPGEILVKTGSASGKATISVSDNGAGIPPKEMERILLPFYTTKDNGTGMGLAMAKRYMTESGGGLDIESALGEGATIRLSFPLGAKGDEEEDAEPLQDEPLGRTEE